MSLEYTGIHEDTFTGKEVPVIIYLDWESPKPATLFCQAEGGPEVLAVECEAVLSDKTREKYEEKACDWAWDCYHNGEL